MLKDYIHICIHLKMGYSLDNTKLIISTVALKIISNGPQITY